MLEHSLISTPHIAGYSADGKANATIQSVRSVSKFFNLGLNKYEVTTLEPKSKLCAVKDELPKLLLQSYEIRVDSDCLRKSASTFELHSSQHPIRFEGNWLFQ